MRVILPHSLGSDEARRRLHARAPDIAGAIPGGLAQVTTTWPTPDRMELRVKVLGHTLTGAVDVAADQLAITLDLPLALSFAAPMIEGTLKAKAAKLLR